MWAMLPKSIWVMGAMVAGEMWEESIGALDDGRYRRTPNKKSECRVRLVHDLALASVFRKLKMRNFKGTDSGNGKRERFLRPRAFLGFP
jgi:hypothetical protein